MKPHPAFGNISNKAVVLRIPEIDLRQMPEAAAWRPAFLFRLRREHWMQNPKLWPLLNEWLQALSANNVLNDYCDEAKARARVFLEFA
jgi:hypothetical protein